jgi:hypothetical protein
VSNDPDSHELLSVIAAVHHKGVCETLDDWALSFSETFASISTGGMGDVDWGADLNVVAMVRNMVLAKLQRMSSE